MRCSTTPRWWWWAGPTRRSPAGPSACDPGRCSSIWCASATTRARWASGTGASAGEWAVRLLVAAPRFPWPLDKGDRLTVFNLLRYFGQRHAVALVCFLEPGQDPAWVRRLGGVVDRGEVVPLPRPSAYARTALGLASRPH